MRQSHEKGYRLYRPLLRRNIVEDQDVTDEKRIFEAVREAGLDEAKFKRDWTDQASLKADLEKQREGRITCPRWVLQRRAD
jgi:predicted DsbA family dithiol-disulfide isomerase